MAVCAMRRPITDQFIGCVVLSTMQQYGRAARENHFAWNTRALASGWRSVFVPSALYLYMPTHRSSLNMRERCSSDAHRMLMLISLPSHLYLIRICTMHTARCTLHRIAVRPILQPCEAYPIHPGLALQLTSFPPPSHHVSSP
jgi:hypothetical protein